MSTKPATFKNILLAEDDPRDVELTLAALEEHHLANKVVVVARRRGGAGLPLPPGEFQRSRRRQSESWSCSTSRCRRSTGWKC